MAHMSPKEIKQLPAARSLLYACGLTDEDIDKPMVAIFGGANDICPGHMTVAPLAGLVAQGVKEAGGTPRIMFAVPGVCDGIAMGHDGMKYSLLTRWLTAHSIEAMYRAHGVFEGAVMIPACDKNAPGTLIAAARMNEPTAMITPGPMWPGEYEGEKLDVVSSFKLRGKLNLGIIDEAKYLAMRPNCCPGAGKCAGLFTANTMGMVTESLGLCLPYVAATPAVEKDDQATVHHEQAAQAIETGKVIMQLIADGVTARQMMTFDSFINALIMDMAMSGSTNLALHLPEIAVEAGVELPLDLINEVSAQIPHLVKMSPAAECWMDDLYRAGGVPAVMYELREHLNLGAKTIEGGTIADRIVGAKNLNPEVIRPISNAHSPTGGMEVYRGSLCPEGAVIKVGAMSKDVPEVFEGYAKVFANEEAATAFIDTAGAVQPGMVLVIGNEGPVYGPGMREMLYPTSSLASIRTADDEPMDAHVALITPGRFSGGTTGPCFGHAAPEDGPIALVKDGDRIVIDREKRTIDLCVSSHELAKRGTAYRAEDHWQEIPERGVLADYRDMMIARRGK